MLDIHGLDKSLVKRISDKFDARRPAYYRIGFAKTGQLDSGGKPQANPCEGLPDGQIWVRQSFNNGVTFSRAAVPAINVGVRDDLTDTPIFVGFDSANDGATLYAIGVAGSPEAAQQYGKALAAIGTPNTPPSVMNNPVPSALVQDGRVLAPSDGSLGFYVEADPQVGWNGGVIAIDPGDIPAGTGEFGGLVVYFPAYSGTPVTPTYLPTTPVVRPNMQAWISGNLSDAVNLALPVGVSRLFAVTVFNGQTGVTPSNTSFINLRRAKVPEDVVSVDASGASPGDVATWNGTAWEADPVPGGGGAADYILIRDQQTSGTDDGTFTSGAWRTRVLNTIVNDAGGHAALSGNQITLDAGTYRMVASAPCYYVDNHAARLRNVTDSADVLLGTSEVAGTAGGNMTTNRSLIIGRFTVAAGKALEIQHQCGTTRAGDGFGHAAGFQTEIYTVVELWKE